MFPRSSFSALLLFATLLALAANPTAFNQHSPSSAHLDASSATGESTLIGTSYLTYSVESTSTFFTNTAPVIPLGIVRADCQMYSNDVPAKKGQEAVGSFIAQNIKTIRPPPPVSVNVSLYIMSEDQFNSWEHQVKPCVINATLLRVENVTSYSLDFVFPQDGKYFFLFFNWSDDYEAGVIWTSGPAIRFATSTTVTSLIYSTTEQRQFLENQSTWIVGAVALLAVLAAGYFLYKRRKA